jgi:hypothetical protein
VSGRTVGYASAPWGTMRRCTAICPDGKVRTIRIHQAADTIRGRTTIKGMAVTGYVSTKDGEYHFHMTYDHPKFDAVYERAIRDLCTCGWRAGHDSRCPATDVYLTLEKKRETCGAGG